MKPMHKIQMQILKNLLFSKSLKYTELKPGKEMENNQFDFHLDQLIKLGFIKKSDKIYLLTNSGKEYANRMDTANATFQKQAKISAVIAPIREIDNKKQYLIYTRLKQPFFGCQGFMSGKVNYGETVEQSTARELKEETNLEGKPEITSIRHYRVFDENTNTIVEDKFMFFCQVINPKKELIASSEGKFEWVDEEDLFNYVTNHFESIEAFERDLSEFKNFKGEIKFLEIDHISDKF
jgi:ADP-ribose pyrophosphatase YjhB (NUDIX family)